MHVRPVIVVAILAVAAIASAVRFVHGFGSPPVVATQSRDEADRSDAGPASESSVNGASPAGFTTRTSARSPSNERAMPSRIVVYVAGNVRHPGVYALGPSARVADALAAAGGPTAAADPLAVNLAAHVEDGEEIAVPERGAVAAASVPDDGTAPPHTHKHAHRHRRRKHARRATAADAENVPPAAVDVNTADAATLETLPGLGAALAERIVAFRSTNGPFVSADELLDVGGVNASEVDRLTPYLRFGTRHTRTDGAAGVWDDAVR